VGPRLAKAVAERACKSLWLRRTVEEAWPGANAPAGVLKVRLRRPARVRAGRGRAGDSEDGLRKGKPELNGDARFHAVGVNSRGIDTGSEGEISNTSGTGGRIDSDLSCNRTALMVTEAKIDMVSDGEESGTNGGANGGANGSGLLVSIV
jgi:hypothetical protein